MDTRIRFTRYILGILLPCALTLVAEAGENKQAAPKQTGPITSRSTQDFKFDVYSFRPVKPGEQGTGGVGLTPDGYNARMPLVTLILTAYGPSGPEAFTTPLFNQPNWIGDRYDLNARVAEADRQAWQSQGPQRDLLRSALQNLLRERFRLVIHNQPIKAQTYDLVVSKRGARLQAAKLQPPAGCHKSNAGTGACFTVVESGAEETYQFYGASLEDLLFMLEITAKGRPVRDLTGLTGKYDFTLRHTIGPDEEPIFSWSIGDLGLQLKADVGTAPTLVIDHIEKPSAD